MRATELCDSTVGGTFKRGLKSSPLRPSLQRLSEIFRFETKLGREGKDGVVTQPATPECEHVNFCVLFCINFFLL